ncbi:hypothetical protein GCM10011581_09850 [Saccharopolyspora subtropica]|uniref:Uncharacterized protein n=2 Tax=Saccharopolyspora thermophila TaxID=89367 RepID=A0A917N7I1_9PSEU|nr:hypothetical protein GCM10011581_09850 [Saccharopolyspora subtropica]
MSRREGTQDMTGYVVDPAAPENAIKKLEDIRDDSQALLRQASEVTPGELVANDSYTTKARKAIQERATGQEGSLRAAAEALEKKLTEKIEEYKAALDEYRRSDEAASAGVSRVEREA